MTELGKKEIRTKSETVSILLGAAFLMATSAIGPGFLTQTISYQRTESGFSLACALHPH
ncbi:hypothetical protein MASR2M79_11670 [Aminivibrio sp.]